MPLSEFLERWTARDMVLLEEAYHIKAVDHLLRDLVEVGETRESVVKWLGHPLEDITPEEEAKLRAWIPGARKALADKKRTPDLPPNNPQKA